MNIDSIAVFGGSRHGNDPLFSQHASELGVFLAENYITLVYDGGSKGIMGVLADAWNRAGFQSLFDVVHY